MRVFPPVSGCRTCSSFRRNLRSGRFSQGFVLAIAAREILLRRPVVRRGWLVFIVCCICCLAISRSMELIEGARR